MLVSIGIFRVKLASATIFIFLFSLFILFLHILGCHKTSMLRLYRAVIRSKLDYVCASVCVRKNILRKLDAIHHSALRIYSGAFRTSPVQSLYVDCNKPSYLTRLPLSLKYYFNVLSHPTHPLYKIFIDKQNDRLYEHRPSCNPHFPLRVTQINNKLHSIKPYLSAWKNHHHRKESVMLTRLRIGHTRLTHQHLLKGEDEPKC